jgi:RNA 2',3'-cyclic 3'-phosphodiesterase
MARLFTAIELSEAVRSAVAARQAAIMASLRAAGDRDLRLVTPAQLHLTLVFIGEVPDDRVAALSDAIAEDIPLAPFDLEIGMPGIFPPQGTPRVLWLAVARGASELVRVHELVAGRLEARGVPREQRPYQPHLTIGRWRDRAPARLRHALVTGGAVPVQRVEAVTLFRSRLGPGGAEHTPLVRARLV